MSCLIPFFFISIIIIIIAYYSSVNRPTVFKILTSNSFSQEGNFGESGRLFAVVSALSWTDKRQETNYFKYIFIYIYKYTHVYLFDQFLTTTPHSEFALLFMHLQQWFLTSFFNVVLICSIALISICSAIFFFFFFHFLGYYGSKYICALILIEIRWIPTVVPFLIRSDPLPFLARHTLSVAV